MLGHPGSPGRLVDWQCQSRMDWQCQSIKPAPQPGTIQKDQTHEESDTPTNKPAHTRRAGHRSRAERPDQPPSGSQLSWRQSHHSPFYWFTESWGARRGRGGRRKRALSLSDGPSPKTRTTPIVRPEACSSESTLWHPSLGRGNPVFSQCVSTPTFLIQPRLTSFLHPELLRYSFELFVPCCPLCLPD